MIGRCPHCQHEKETALARSTFELVFRFLCWCSTWVIVGYFAGTLTNSGQAWASRVEARLSALEAHP